jgi:hypothetical protein
VTEKMPVKRLSAREIADEITRTRARLSHTLALADREYALRNLFVHGLRAARDAKVDRSHLAEEIRGKAVPFVLIAVGVAWLTFGRAQGADLLRRLSRAFAHVQDFARQLSDISRT